MNTYVFAAKMILVVPTCLALAGCVGMGPQAGITFAGDPTLGWELTALSVSTGQSYRLTRRHREPWEERPWDKRTYVVWEPGLGAPVGSSSWDSTVWLAGGGATLGARWDVREAESDEGDSDERRTVVDSAPIYGLWAGSNVSVPSSPDPCETQPRWYGSLSIGWRGDEVYLTPKVGFFVWPAFCLNLSGLNGL